MWMHGTFLDLGLCNIVASGDPTALDTGKGGSHPVLVALAVSLV
jgi:hypothetical protein